MASEGVSSMIELIEVVDVENSAPPREPVCKDHDSDCEDIEDRIGCWLYDMGKGRCPYLTNDK
jgi:hypothetical protein